MTPLPPSRHAFPADQTGPRAARRVARAAAEACGVDAHAVALCVTEAVTNAVVHGYRDTPPPCEVVVELIPLEPGLEVCVEDHGGGLAPRPDSPGLGLGMPLIVAMTDRIEIDSSPAGTRLCMHFSPTA